MQELLERLIKRLNDHSDGFSVFSQSVGRKYIKILESRGGVHAFIDKNNGDVYKPASWAKPADHVRYNLFNDIDQLEKIADSHGRYLYIR